MVSRRGKPPGVYSGRVQPEEPKPEPVQETWSLPEPMPESAPEPAPPSAQLGMVPVYNIAPSVKERVLALLDKRIDWCSAGNSLELSHIRELKKEVEAL